MTRTPEEIKKGLECCTDGNFTCMQCPYRDLAPDCSKALRADYSALFQKLEAQVPRWIPVEERRPENGTMVLCCGTKGGLFLADTFYYLETDVTMYCHVPNSRHGRYAAYWMPLPGRPGEEA